MKATVLIQRMQEMVMANGDLEVADFEGDSIETIETDEFESDSGTENVFILST